jgi:hypothetical protein
MMLRYKQTRQTRATTARSKKVGKVLKAPPVLPNNNGRYPKRVSLDSNNNNSSNDHVLLRMKAPPKSLYKNKNKKTNNKTNKTINIVKTTVIPPSPPRLDERFVEVSSPSTTLRNSPYMFSIDDDQHRRRQDQDDTDKEGPNHVMMTSPSFEKVATTWKTLDHVNPNSNNQGQEQPVLATPIPKRVSVASLDNIQYNRGIGSRSAFTPVTPSPTNDKDDMEVHTPSFRYQYSKDMMDGYVMKTPITSAASVLIAMMKSPLSPEEESIKPLSLTECLEKAASISDSLQQDERTNTKKPKTVSATNTIKKRPEKTVHKKMHPVKAKDLGMTSTASATASTYRRIPRRLIDDPNISTLKGGMRLTMPDDHKELNSLHCFVRSELLEVFVLHANEDGYPRVG